MAREKEIPSAEYRIRELPNVARELGEKSDDMKEFVRCVTPSVIGRIVGCEEVGLARWVETGPHRQPY